MYAEQTRQQCAHAHTRGHTWLEHKENAVSGCKLPAPRLPRGGREVHGISHGEEGVRSEYDSDQGRGDAGIGSSEGEGDGSEPRGDARVGWFVSEVVIHIHTCALT